MGKTLSKQRQVTYYVGNGITLVGVLLFLSFFLSVATFMSGPSMGFDGFSLSTEGAGGQNFYINSQGEVVMNKERFSPFNMMPTSRGPNVTLAVLGFIMIAGGQMVANIGRSGLAGSGVLLDPQRAREDLRPFNTAKGQMINDTLGEIDVVQSIAGKMNQQGSVESTAQEPLVKIRCRHCKTLNLETAKFCQECGQSV